MKFNISSNKFPDSSDVDVVVVGEVECVVVLVVIEVVSVVVIPVVDVVVTTVVVGSSPTFTMISFIPIFPARHTIIKYPELQ